MDLTRHRSVLAALYTKISIGKSLLVGFQHNEGNQLEASRFASFCDEIIALRQDIDGILNANRHLFERQSDSFEDVWGAWNGPLGTLREAFEDIICTALGMRYNERGLCYLIEGKLPFNLRPASIESEMRVHTLFSWHGSVERYFVLERLLWILEAQRTGKDLYPEGHVPRFDKADFHNGTRTEVLSLVPEQYKWIGDDTNVPSLEVLAFIKLVGLFTEKESRINSDRDLNKRRLEQMGIWEEPKNFKDADKVEAFCEQASAAEIHGESCPICSIAYLNSGDDEEEQSEVSVKTPCGHIFGRGCLQTWVDGNANSCPSCRGSLFSVCANILRLKQKQEDVVLVQLAAINRDVDDFLLNLTWDNVKDKKVWGEEVGELLGQLGKLEDLRAERYEAVYRAVDAASEE